MDAEGTLEVIAEISIAFTGFAGIVGALAGARLRPAQRTSSVYPVLIKA